MMYISIKADHNDGDYVTEISEIKDSEVDKIRKIISKMPKSFSKIRYETGEIGNDDKEDSNYNYLSYEEKMFLDRFLPIGDSNYLGIHTIVEVKIFKEIYSLL